MDSASFPDLHGPALMNMDDFDYGILNKRFIFMIRAWLGVALLAGAVQFAGGLYYPPDFGLAGLLTLAATVLLSGPLPRLNMPRANVTAIGLLVLPAVLLPWPVRAIPLLIFAGLLLILPRWPRPWGRGIVSAGVILGAQALTIAGFAAKTARSHDLPAPLPELLALIARLLGMDAAADGSYVVLHSMRQPHKLAATWDLLFDPATLCFYVGGLVIWAMIAATTGKGDSHLLCEAPSGPFQQKVAVTFSGWNEWIRGLRIMTLILIVWLPVRAGLLIALYLQRVLRTDANVPLDAMNHFFAPWPLTILLVVPVLLAWRFIKPRPVVALHDADAQTATNSIATNGRGFMGKIPIFSMVLMGLAGAVWMAAATWSPMGPRKEGRVMVVERHSDWEPTDMPYDTKTYGEKKSSYNYAALYDYLGQYYEMSRLPKSGKIDDDTLKQCDVLIVKTPTERYSADEVRAVQKFVEQGGGLLLIGDHTNVFKSSTVMNDIIRPMGFIFRDDLLFGNGKSPYDEHFDPPRLAHPALQNTPPFDFAVSCSIDPGFSRGEPVITGFGLWSMGPYYHADNNHPVPQRCPEMRYGAFMQIWAAYYGAGRALAFADSTILSNFSIFQPGKAELARGMVEWLNHGNPPLRPGLPLSALGLVFLGAGLWLVRGRWMWWLPMLASGMLGIALGGEAVAAMHRRAMPTPEVKRPMARVVIDRTTSQVPLGIGPFAVDKTGRGYAMLERWIYRIKGLYTIRLSGEDVFSGDAVVIINPNRTAPKAFRKELKRYVERGGNLLVLDDPENRNSTANEVLRPFGLTFLRQTPWQGTLSLTDGWPNISVESGWEVKGGTPIAKFGDTPVAAETTFGKGRVMAVGFASLFDDQHMATVGDTGPSCLDEPTEEQLPRYETLYALIRRLVKGEAIVGPSERAAKPLPRGRLPMLPPPSQRQPLQDLPGKELGPQEEGPK